MIEHRQRLYTAGALGILAFILAQTFQELAYALWIPASHGVGDDLRIMLLPIDKARSVVILATIITLLIPYAALAINRFSVAPLASVLGLIGVAAFVLVEAIPRSIDLFTVGDAWAHAYQAAATDADRLAIVGRVTMLQQIEHGWFFVTMSSYLLGSVAFAVATWRNNVPWRWLAPAGFLLNALRLTGRIASTFGGQTWLSALNDAAYYPAVLVVNSLLLAWFILEARRTLSPGKEQEISI